jgi:ribosomal protein S18 acetylase RimI-like enzyme
VVVREAGADDVEGIAEVHLMSWRTTYKGIISNSYLSNLTLERRKRNWLWTFNHLNQDETIFVAETREGRIVGFSSSGRNRNSEYPHEGEVYAIYLLKEFQRQGIGRSLFKASVNSLIQRGYQSMMLWVLENNPTLGFYQHMGGKVIGKKEITIGEDQYIELVVGWDDMPTYHSVGSSDEK